MKRVFSIFILLVAFSSAFSAPVPDLGQHGPYEVGFTYFLLLDNNRETGSGLADRPVPVYLWYPVDDEDITGGTSQAFYPVDPPYGVLGWLGSSYLENYGIDRAYHEPPPSSDAPFPLVMFSPGWGAPSLLHASIGTRLASHGFAVAVVTHFADGSFPWDVPHHLAVAAMNRPLDLSFALNYLLARSESPGDLLYGVVNPEQVGAAGWSLGGYAALALASGDDSVCDTFSDPAFSDIYGPPPLQTCVSAQPDPRFKAIVTLDGSNQILRFSELARIETPTMGIGEEFEAVSDWQARQHAAIQAQPSYRVDLNDSKHESFSDTCEAYSALRDAGILPADYVDPILQQFCSDGIQSSVAHQLVNKYMIAFFKTQLAGESGYQRILTPGWAITKEPDIEFFMTEKKSSSAINDDWPDMFIYFTNQPGSETANGYKDPDSISLVPHLDLMNSILR